MHNCRRLKQDSDAKFRIRIRDAEGNQIDPRGVDMTIELYTSRMDIRRMDIGRFAIPEGVTFDGNDLLVAIDRPPFPCGRLYAKVTVHADDLSYPDEVRDVSSGEVLTNIIVVK